MSTSEERYVPAAGRAGFNRLYDPVMAATMRERSWRPALLEVLSAALPSGGTALDVGAGTGELSIRLSRMRPDATVIGVDGDPGILTIAGAKPGAEAVTWKQGLADELPAGDESTDVVVISLVLHHLSTAAKERALREARRVLRPRGKLVIADWGRPRGALPVAGFTLLRLLDGLENTRDHAEGRLHELVVAAGFDQVNLFGRLATAFGTLELIEAS